MPFKSKAQRRKFAELLVEGKISPDTFEEWNRETGAKELPEHVNRSSGKKTKRQAKRSAAKARRTGAARKRATRRRTAKQRA